jgi:uncharacterized protein (DUF2461 family)
MPRINRDVRFSRDKSPYKTNLGALVAPGGWRATAQGYYISLERHGQSMVAGGLYDRRPNNWTASARPSTAIRPHFGRLCRPGTSF